MLLRAKVNQIHYQGVRSCLNTILVNLFEPGGGGRVLAVRNDGKQVKGVDVLTEREVQIQVCEKDTL